MASNIADCDRAQNDQEDEEEEFSSSDDGDSEDTDSDSDAAETQGSPPRPPTDHCQAEPCRHYNRGFCRYGPTCRYLHFCKYGLKGSCRHGDGCRLAHPQTARPTVSGHHGDHWEERDGSSSRAPTERKLEDGRPYQWQLNDGDGWRDLANHHILEAQYSLPHVKGIKIYNTPFGVVSIDFRKMRVLGKELRVRRLEGQQTKWIWFYKSSHGWIKYGKKDSKGNGGPGQSSEIEEKFQTSPGSSFTFNVGADTFEIRFREMRQVGKRRKRRVARRPKYQPPSGQGSYTGASQSEGGASSASQSPEWKFDGRNGKWHTFRKSQSGSGCSVSSADIEAHFQSNPRGSMSFTINGQPCKLDFSALKQTNLSTHGTRRIKRFEGSTRKL